MHKQTPQGLLAIKQQSRTSESYKYATRATIGIKKGQYLAYGQTYPNLRVNSNLNIYET
jgi:hypothetical protein